MQSPDVRLVTETRFAELVGPEIAEALVGLGLDPMELPDAVVAELITNNGVGPLTRAALFAAIEDRNDNTNAHPLGRIWKAASGPFRVHVYGMSITSFDNSPARVACEQLANVYGRVGELFVRSGVLGGSWQAAYNGWEKQFYGGVSQIRARGKAASTSLLYWFYGDTYELAFSREANSEACVVKVDGVNVGSSPAAGAQAFNQKVTGTVALGPHKIEITVPAGGGYCYSEYVLGYDSTRPGVMALDFTLGGSLLKQMTAANSFGAATAPMVTAIATSGNNGITAHYDRPEVDWFINGHDVNDIFDPTTVASAMATIVSLVSTNGNHLTNLSSMAGHFALTAESGGTGYTAIRDLYRDLARDHNFVTWVDWDGATRPTQAQVDGGTYAARFYTLPDFIHPNTVGTTLGVAAFCEFLGIPVPAKFWTSTVFTESIRRPAKTPVRRKISTFGRGLDRTYSIVAATDVISFPRPHGLRVGDQIVFGWSDGISPAGMASPYFVKTVPSLNSITVSATLGGATKDLGADKNNVAQVTAQLQTLTPGAAGGYALEGQVAGYGSTIVPVFAIPNAVNFLGDTAATIQSAPTGTDKYGPYKTISNAAIYPDVSLYLMPVTTLTARVAGSFSVRPAGAWRLCDSAGQIPPTPTTDAFNTLADADGNVEPVTYTVHMIDPTGGNEYIVLTAGKLYDLCWTFGDAAILGSAN